MDGKAETMTGAGRSPAVGLLIQPRVNAGVRLPLQLQLQDKEGQRSHGRP
jgi:hypothetical protein